MDRPAVYARTEGDSATERKLVFSNRTIRQAAADTLSPPPNMPNFYGWQDLSKRISTLAGEIEKALKR